MRITVSLPDHVAARFLAAIPRGRRSAAVARLLERELATPERQLERACHAVNGDRALAAEIDEWQSFGDPDGRRARRCPPVTR